MPSKIKKRGKNSYQFFVPDGYDAFGKQKGFTETVHADNDTDAKKKYDQFKADCLHGKVLAVGTEKMTVKQFYYYWKENYALPNHEKSTIAYNDFLFIRIEAVLGHLRMDKVNPPHLLDFLKQLSADDVSATDGPLKDNTIRKYFILLNELFASAVSWKLLLENPVANIKVPKYKPPKKKILNADSLAKLLTEIEKEPIKYQLMVALAFTRGLRREEIFGLKWGDFDLKRRKVKIDRAVVYVPGEGIIINDGKTDNSCRALSMSRTLTALVQAWKAALKATVKRRNKRNKVVSIEDPTGPDKWVFQQHNGNVGHPHSFTTFLRRFCQKKQSQSASPHLLRHMWGSYLLREGIDIARISAEIGHGDKAFTMRTYIHEIEEEKEKTADAMDDLVAKLKENQQSPEAQKGQA